MRLTLALTRRENASTWARPFTARLLEPGLVSYHDRGHGVALLRKETIDRFVNSFVGRPVIVRHLKTTPGNMKAIGHGYVTDVYYNDADGWWYGKGVVDTDEAADEIRNSGFCSVGYKVTANERGGVHHNMKFDEEITGFSGEHLAIVGNPRYEDATIRLNSKTTITKTTMKLPFFSKKDPAANPAAAAPAAVVKPADDTAGQSRENAVPELKPEHKITLVAADGKEIETTLADLGSAYLDRENGIDLDQEVEIDGEPVKLNALVDAFKASKAAKPVGDKSRENASKPDHFRLLMTASARPADVIGNRADIDTREQRIARGKELYGSSVTTK